MSRARTSYGSTGVQPRLLLVGVAVALWAVGLPTSEQPDAGARGLSAGRSVPAVATLQGNRDRVLKAYARLPLTFVENQGQTDARVRYYAQGPRYSFSFTQRKVVLSFLEGFEMPWRASRPSTRGVGLALRFVGSNPRAVIEANGRAPGEVNYLLGNDPARWRTRLPHYTRIVYRKLWPGVDLLLRGKGGELKYEFRVRPGARPSDIRLAYVGASGLALDSAGGLEIDTPMGRLRDSAPVSYQEIAGARVPVESRYILKQGTGSTREYGFTVGAGYRSDRALIIDPSLDNSTFLGGSNHDFGNGIATDAGGNAYVVGTTFSSNFPTTTGAFDRTLAAAPDVFITKLNPTGSALVYSTYLGGTPTPVPAGGSDPFEFGRGIVVDAAGNAYVTGQTTSGNFPTTSGAFDRSLNVGTFDATDAFVTKLNASGSGLVYSTFLGGTDLDDSLDIDIDGSGNAYVTGQTASTNLPTTTGAFDRSSNGGFDAFVTKLNAAGSALVYSTYLGGADNELPGRVAVDGTGNTYVAGSTRSAGFPTTPASFDPTHNGGSFETLFDAFVTKLNPTGSGLVYSTFLGGSNIEFGDGLALDSAGNAYVVGGTLSPGFPTTPGAFDTVFNGESEGFVTKLNSSGSTVAYSTFLRGAGASAVAVDANNKAWLAGAAGSATAPTTPDGFDTSHNGGTDAWVGALNPAGSNLVYASFLGGANSEVGRDVALDSAANVYVTGQTFSSNFPTTAGAFDRTFDGNPDIFWGDGFVTKFGSGGEPPPAPPPVPIAPTLLSPAEGARPRQPITFDWTDVANAASYRIQIDTSSSFTAPLVSNQIVTASQFRTSGLANVRHWWRVRAINSAGSAGPFSAVRSFRPR